MIHLQIPGMEELRLDNLMLDFNGTLAIDGTVLDGVQQRIDALSKHLNVVVVTGDSHGTAKEQLRNFECEVHVIGPDEQGQQKLTFLRSLGENITACIGNGMNDKYVVQAAALGVIVCLQEGASMASAIHADIVCRDILDALDLFLNPLRIVTTLRS
jgi:P-type E1-E2 ATPase